MIVIGLDIGTQGVRAIAVDMKGTTLASNSAKFEKLDVSSEVNFKEQEPEDWWSASKAVLSYIVKDLAAKNINANQIKAISIDGTSGTILPIDEENNPLYNGIMYNDARSGKEVDEMKGFVSDFERKLGYKFNASYALPKILWLRNNKPNIVKKVKLYIHQADFIVGKLSGEYGISDYSNALKTGYDLIDYKWPEFISNLGINKEQLPKIKAPGQIICKVNENGESETGLKAGTLIVAGASDGYASALSSGVVKPGDWATVIGTTMVLKGVTKQLVLDDKGRIYSHRHPEGYWMPGGASNVGGRCLNDFFGTARFEELNRSVLHESPTGVIIYPLTGQGERFPFVNTDAEYFCSEDNMSDGVRYTALMEGVAYTERLAYETLESLGCEVNEVICSAGGACKSDEWLQVRANILGKTLKVPKETDAAMGVAVLAATTVAFDSLQAASKSMVNIVKVIKPDLKNKEAYDSAYLRFKKELELRGMI